uniref:Uncharacterized protein n=1 Tax=Physcomitrium patens TaxID=3218 RepID=A0A2K1J1F1_PHYPA|nr:hypothetical protein PHYPA_023251 [Physcomitrium patens]
MVLKVLLQARSRAALKLLMELLRMLHDPLRINVKLPEILPQVESRMTMKTMDFEIIPRLKMAEMMSVRLTAPRKRLHVHLAGRGNPKKTMK